jgi:Protein of unknown function (DUF3106)
VKPHRPQAQQAPRAPFRVAAAFRGICVGLPFLLSSWTAPVWSQSPATPARPSAAAAPAPETAGKESRPFWQQLTAAQKEVLSPLRSEWASIDASRKQTWLELAARMPAMSTEERTRVQQRMSEWVALSPRERGQVRIQFQEARRLAPGGRQEHWDAYQALPAEQRRALAAQAVATPKKSGSSTVAKSQNSPQASVALIKPTTQSKKNIVSVPAPTSAPKLVSPTIVQSRQGATTSLVTTPAKPPAFHQAGLPKLNAGEGFVDQTTLLPLRGPQGAAAVKQPRPPQPAELVVPSDVEE